MRLIASATHGCPVVAFVYSQIHFLTELTPRTEEPQLLATLSDSFPRSGEGTLHPHAAGNFVPSCDLNTN